MRTKEEINRQARERYAKWRKSCPAVHPKRKPGDVFGWLTIVKRLGPSPSTTGCIWLCRCICGTEKPVDSANLNRGVKSCGCFKKSEEYRQSKKRLRKYLTQEDAAFHSLLQYYQYSATKRGLLFELPEDIFRQLVNSDCEYCGAEPSGNWKLKSGGKTADVRHTYKFNGVDRKQNDIGYTVLNSVSCCWTCNKMKTDQDSESFIVHVTKIARRCG